MQLVASILPYAQIIFSVVLVVAVLLEQSGAAVGGALGGSGDSFHNTRRGFQKFLFYVAIISGILFALSAFLDIMIKARG